MRFLLTAGVCLLASAIAVCADETATAHFVGSSSCATFGCHGNTTNTASEVWKSSFVLWSRGDPHAGAYEILFGERSQRMVELLLPIGEAQGQGRGVPGGTSPLTDVEYATNYRLVLERRCVGCHATPVPSDDSHPAAAKSTKADLLRRGVTCESCHGAAGRWLAEHATERWTNVSAGVKSQRWGLTNTKDISVRAEVCVDCHMGPRLSAAGKRYEVTHELIAAGHPKLAFEFSAYLENLPRHWNDDKDKSRHGPHRFHFDAWRVGQFQMARKLAEQLSNPSAAEQNVSAPAVWPELANFECFDCHHRLQGERRAAGVPTSSSLRTRGQPRPADWPFAQLQSIARSSANETIRALEQPLEAARAQFAFEQSKSPAGRQQAFATLGQALNAASPSLLEDSLSPVARLQVLEHLLAEILAQRAASWERLVQFHLALSAFVDDGDPQDAKRAGLSDRGRQLANWLDGRFGDPRLVSIYHSPQKFDPADNELMLRLQEISAHLRTMH